MEHRKDRASQGPVLLVASRGSGVVRRESSDPGRGRFRRAAQRSDERVGPQVPATSTRSVTQSTRFGISGGGLNRSGAVRAIREYWTREVPPARMKPGRFGTHIIGWSHRSALHSSEAFRLQSWGPSHADFSQPQALSPRSTVLVARCSGADNGGPHRPKRRHGARGRSRLRNGQRLRGRDVGQQSRGHLGRRLHEVGQPGRVHIRSVAGLRQGHREGGF